MTRIHDAMHFRNIINLTCISHVFCYSRTNIPAHDIVILIALATSELPRILACADPESFVRGSPTLITIFFLLFFVFSLMREEGSKNHYTRAIIDPPAKHHLNGLSLACR